MSHSFRALIFIVAYNAERHIVSVLDRIPESIWLGSPYQCDVLVIDDFSTDHTWQICREYSARTSRRVTALRTPSNQGYGGNQKLGYTYAIANGYDAVVMLHGDGQYAPEMLPQILAPLAAGTSDAVFGSRMLHRKDALKGGMPLYKFAANIALTTVQNIMIGTHLSEYHTGYRAYAISALSRIPFKYNSDWFDFDTDIIIQLADQKMLITEIAIPTHYGDEICRVQNLRYGIAILKACLQSRLQRFGIFYHRKFDYEGINYKDKTSFDSSHAFAVAQVAPGETVMDIGCGIGHAARILHAKGCRVYGMDHYVPEDISAFVSYTAIDLESGMEGVPNLQCDAIMLLDVIEHLNDPESFMEALFDRTTGTQTRVILTTPNIAFIIMRMMLLIGRFEYGKRGILDKTHKRLFTFPSLRRMAEQSGFIIERMEGIPAPFPLALNNKLLGGLLLTLNRWMIYVSKGMFSFQIGMVLKPKKDFDTVFEETLCSQLADSQPQKQASL